MSSLAPWRACPCLYCSVQRITRSALQLLVPASCSRRRSPQRKRLTRPPPPGSANQPPPQGALTRRSVCDGSAEPAGGAAERHEGRRDAATGHAVQGPAHRRPPADVGEEHPQPTGQQGHRDAHAPGQQPASNPRAFTHNKRKREAAFAASSSLTPFIVSYLGYSRRRCPT